MPSLDQSFNKALSAATGPKTRSRQEKFLESLRKISRTLSKAYTEMQNVAHQPGLSSEFERELDGIAEVASRMSGYVAMKSNGHADDRAHQYGMKRAQKVRKAMGYTHP